jgi:hypothetical protein
MVVHDLHVAGGKAENPGFQILAAEKIDTALAFLAALRHFQNI